MPMMLLAMGQADVELEARVAALEAKLASFEARQDIEDLIARFARAADAHCDPALLEPLFTSDAIFDIGDFGRLEGGGAAIAKEMHANNKDGFYWTLHYLVSPRIRFETSKTALVDFYLFEPAALHPKNARRAFWIGGVYTAQAVLQQGAWAFRHLALTLELLSRRPAPWGTVPAGFDALVAD